VLCVLGLVTLFIGSVQAAPPSTPPWYLCTVQGAGGTWTDSYITCTDTVGTAFTNRTFIIDNSTGKANQMLAAALTAFANSTNVYLYLTDTTEFAHTLAVFSAK
jgi:hypothetical protein